MKIKFFFASSHYRIAPQWNLQNFSILTMEEFERKESLSFQPFYSFNYWSISIS